MIFMYWATKWGMSEIQYSDVRGWRLKKPRYGLVGEVCPRCDFKIFPPRKNELCPNCGPEGLITLDMLVEAQTREAAEKAARLALVTTPPEFVG